MSYNTSKFEHITPVLASLHLQPVHLQFEIHFEIILFVLKAMNALAPMHLSEFLHPANLLKVPKSRLKGDQAFSDAIPKLRNELSLQIRHAYSVSVFKSLFKTHILSFAFNTT